MTGTEFVPFHIFAEAAVMSYPIIGCEARQACPELGVAVLESASSVRKLSPICLLNGKHFIRGLAASDWLSSRLETFFCLEKKYRYAEGRSAKMKAPAT
jgi:hypothetical protein